MDNNYGYFYNEDSHYDEDYGDVPNQVNSISHLSDAWKHADMFLRHYYQNNKIQYEPHPMEEIQLLQFHVYCRGWTIAQFNDKFYNKCTEEQRILSMVAFAMTGKSRDPHVTNELHNYKEHLKKFIALLCYQHVVEEREACSWILTSFSSLKKQIEARARKLGLNVENSMFIEFSKTYNKELKRDLGRAKLMYNFNEEQVKLILDIMPRGHFQRHYGYTRSRINNVPLPKFVDLEKPVGDYKNGEKCLKPERPHSKIICNTKHRGTLNKKLNLSMWHFYP